MIRFKILTTTALFGVGACSGVPPVTFATPNEIAALYGAETAPNMPPASAYATTCYDRNLRAGTTYFNGLVKKQNDAGKFAMLGSTAGAILGAAGGPAGALGGLAAGTALGTGLLNAEASPGGELPVTAYSLWQRQNGAYLLAVPTPQDQPTAQLLCDANTALATPIGIQAAQMAAMMSAPVVAVPSVPTGPVVVPGPIVLPTPTPVPTPPIVVPPPIVVVPPPDDPNGPIVNPTFRGELTPPGTPLPHHHRSRTRAIQPSQEELQFRAVQQYGRNAVEGGQRVLPPMLCVGYMRCPN